MQILRSLKNKKGFTLIEAVVATSVFAFVVSSALGVYMAAIRIDTKTRSQRAVQQNARFIMEFLGKEIRNGTLNYSATGGTVVNVSGQSYTDSVNVVNQLDEVERIYCNGNALSLTKATGSTNLNTNDVKITRCAFYIAPLTDPFRNLSQTPPNQQPTVTVVLQITSNYGSRNVDLEVLNLQTTFTTRNYPSRE